MASSVSLTGFSGGLDTNALITQLMAVAQQPVTLLQTQNQDRQSKLSILSDLTTKLNDLRSSVDGLNTMSGFQKFAATTSDVDDSHFAVTLGANAQPTSHTIQVTQLATAEKDVSQEFAAANSALATGDFKLTIDGVDTTVTLTSANNTLQGLRDAINNSGAKVTATLMNDGSSTTPYRLVITANDTGKAMTIDTSAMSGGDVPAFTHGVNPGDPGQQARMAQFTFDGVSIQSASNSVQEVVSGVSLKLKKADLSNEYTIDVANDVGDVLGAIKTFVGKYNDVMTYLKAKNDPSVTDRDPSYNQIQQSLRGIVSSSISNGGAYSGMSQFGIKTDGTGQLTVDDDTLTSALADHFSDVERVMTAFGSASNSNVHFQGGGDTTTPGTYNVVITGVGASFGGTIGGYAATSIGSTILSGAQGTPVAGLSIGFSGATPGAYGTVTYTNGIMQQFYKTLDDFANPIDGLLKNASDVINRQINDTQKQIDNKQQQLSEEQDRLTQQFTQMQLQLAKLQTQGSTLSSMLSSSSS